MNWTTAPFCLAADVFFKDTGADGVQLGTFFGAPRCHGNGYYNLLASDCSVHKYIDRNGELYQLNHFQQEEGMIFFTTKLR